MITQEARPYIILTIVVMGASLAVGSMFGYALRSSVVDQASTIAAPQLAGTSTVNGSVSTSAAFNETEAPPEGMAPTSSVTTIPVPSQMLKLVSREFTVRKVGDKELNVSTGMSGGEELTISMDARTMISRRSAPKPASVGTSSSTKAGDVPPPPVPGVESGASMGDVKVGSRVQIDYFVGSGKNTAFSIVIQE